MKDGSRPPWCSAAVLAGSLAAGLLSSLSAAPQPGFGAPEIVKLDWSTRALASGDLNGDGLRDLVLLNNDRAQLVLLYQLAEGAPVEPKRSGVSRNRWEPVLEDARFRVETISVGYALFDLALGDMNRDGRPDLIFTGRDVPLSIRFQEADGTWMESAEFTDFQPLGWVKTVRVADLDGDGADELVVLAADAVRVFQSVEGFQIAEPQIYPITGENPFNLLLADVTGDARTDLLFLSVDGKQALTMRRQLPSGGFGPEIRTALERPSRTLDVWAAAREGVGAGLVSVDARGGTLELLELQHSAAAGSGGLFGGGPVAPAIYPVPQAGGSRIPPSYALVDFEGDGRAGLAVANPTKAEILVFERVAQGFRLRNAFPSFSNVNSLSGARFFGDGVEDLLVLSETEKTLGLSHFNERGRSEFPRALFPFEDEPIVAAALDLDRDGFDELAWIGKTGEGNYRLWLMRPDDRAARGSGWSVIESIDLDGVRRAPSALRLLDTFGPSRPGLMVFVPREPPLLLAPQAPTGALTAAGEASAPVFRPVAQRSPIRESFLKGLSPSEVSFFDSDGDGVKEFVVARPGFARAYRLDGDTLLMVDQFNARRGTDAISAVVPDIESGVLRGLVFYIEAEGTLQFLRPDADGVFRYEHSVEAGRITPLGVASVPDGASGRHHLFFGADRFWFFPSQSTGGEWQIAGRYETDLEGIRYTDVVGADFNLDGRPELFAIDGTANVADLLTDGEGTGWRSRLYWEIFEQDMHYQGRKGANLEPREVLVDDFNGDGRPDLVFLLHDRLLMYPQQ